VKKNREGGGTTFLFVVGRKGGKSRQYHNLSAARSGKKKGREGGKEEKAVPP